jgi:anaerobic magnesium-protoporphyrin IX monomethyl ester cyclase
MVRVLFLQDNGINESLAVADLGAHLLRLGHTVQLLLGDEEPRLRRAIRRAAPDLVIIPCPVGGHLRALRDARLAKQVRPECLTLLGGTYATFAPELARRAEVDLVLRGEAEGSVGELARHLDLGRSWTDVPSLCFEQDGELICNPMRPLLTDLDDLPPPARELYFRYPFLAAFPWKKFATGRGCVYDCAFCWNGSLRAMTGAGAGFVRRKSPARAVAEVLAVRERHPLRRVHFSDDLFTIHPAWLDEFALRYATDVGLPFTCNSAVQQISPRAVYTLRRAGCAGVAIGVETGNAELRRKILNKRVSDDAIRSAAGLIKGEGMRLTTFNMVGSPGETAEDVWKTIALNREIKADSVRVSIAIPLPHTAFEETALSLGFAENRVVAEDVSRLDEARIVVDGEHRQALLNLFLLFRAGVHLPKLDPLVRRLARLPSERLLRPLGLGGPYEEKRINGLSWVEGLRFFAHSGDPRSRTANYVTLI